MLLKVAHDVNRRLIVRIQQNAVHRNQKLSSLMRREDREMRNNIISIFLIKYTTIIQGRLIGIVSNLIRFMPLDLLNLIRIRMLLTRF